MLTAMAAVGCGEDATETTPTGPGAGSSGTTAGSTSGSGTGTGSGGGGGSGGAAPGCSGLSPDVGDFEGTVQSSGEARTHRVHVPPSYVPTQATMLVLNFHGLLESAADIEQISQMTPVSDAQGFIVAYPQGISSSWNAGSCCSPAATQDVDDVQYARDLIDALAATYCIDPRRIYATGFSNGGMLSHRFGCELSDRIAAIGGVSGTVAVESCAPGRPVPVAHFHGTADFIVPYNGGGAGGAESVDETILGWVQRNGCTDAAPTVVFQEGDATCEEYSSCNEGAAVRLCTLDGGGHQWPGGESAGLGGPLNMDISASQALGEFFAAHPMP
jgi:polyhydroxybutyrate depolymerase